MKSSLRLLNVFSALLMAALLLSGCAPTAFPPVLTTTATSQPSKTLEVTTEVTKAIQDDLPLIYFSRSGGIVGFCDKVTIFGGGWAQVTSCRNNAASQITLSSDQRAKIAFWQANLTGYKYDHSNGDVPDGMTIHLVFSGNGNSSASITDQEAMMNMASDLALAASK